MEERFLTRKQAAELTGFKQQTLEKWATTDKGPKFFKYGNGRSARVRYALSDLLEFMRSSGEKASA